MAGIILNLAMGVAAGAIVAVGGLLLFDRDKLRRRLFTWFGIGARRSFERISSRRQVQDSFRQVFLDDVGLQQGRILLMSHTGGYPEFDPFPRLLEFASHPDVDVTAAVTDQTIRAYLAHRPDVLRALISSSNVGIYSFPDLTPYRFRIGLNTHTGFAFFCAYFGHADNRVELEGIRTRNPVMIQAIEALFDGLLTAGTRLTRDQLKAWEAPPAEVGR